MKAAALSSTPQPACPAGNKGRQASSGGPSSILVSSCAEPLSAASNIRTVACTAGGAQLAGALAASNESTLIPDPQITAMPADLRMNAKQHGLQHQLQLQKQHTKTAIQLPVYAFKADLVAAIAEEDHALDAGLAAATGSPPQSRLTEDNLVQWFHGQCYPGKPQRIGIEWEQFVVRPGSGQRAEIKEIKAVLQGLADHHGWQSTHDPSVGLVSVRKDGHIVDYEAGGQLELSAPPVDTVWDIAAQMESFGSQLAGVLRDQGLVALSMGYDPINRFEEVPVAPKERVQLLAQVLPQIGSTGMRVLQQACAIQMSFDYLDEADMVRKLRVGLGLQPVVVALSACSPFQGGQPSGFLSHRAGEWLDYDSSQLRTGIMPVAFEADMGFARYVRHAMDIPMLVVRQKGDVIPCVNQRWTDYMQGRLPALPGRCPTMTDWQLHLGTTYPEVRLKSVLEMRGADAGPPEMNLALVALWVGLLYCPKSLAAAEELVCSWTAAEREAMYKQVPKQGLQTPLRGGTVLDVARQAVALAREGLVERGHREEAFLQPLEQVAASGKCPAEDLLDAYYGAWGQSVRPMFSTQVLAATRV